MRLLLSFLLLTVLATESQAEDDTDGTRRLPAPGFALPIEIERDSGANNGDATIIRFLPVYSLPIHRDWRLVNLDLVTLADAPGGVPGRASNPNPVPGPRVFGLSDWIHVSLLEPESSSAFLWGVGAALSVPTATDEVLGSGKWAAGPALRLTYRSGPWNVGAIAAQRWSFAGDSDRGDINQLMIRGALRYGLPHDWFLLSAPIINANWDAASGQRWLVPLGGGLGRTFEIASRRWALSLQGYYNAVRPSGAPDWTVRLGIIAVLPF